MPEIGSRISLISKADIRYEGKLYSVDPEECTIALSSVRSYGTEDRKTSYPVPAQNQVYDYILFRGSDIKDIRVLTTTIPNDPAIVQLSVPPSINELQFQSQSGYPPPSIGSMTIPTVVPGPSRGQPSAGDFHNAAGFVQPASGTNITHSIPKPQPVPNISEDGSRSSTPSTQNAVHHKPTGGDSNRQQNASTSDEQTQQRRPAYQQRDNRANQQNRYQQQKPQYHQQQQHQQQQRYPQQQQQQHQNQRYAQQNQRYPQQQRYMQPQYRDYRDNNNQYRNQNDYRDQYAQRQYPKWNNQRTGGQQTNQHQRNYQSQADYQNRKPRNTLKFENDFDFEQANSQFEEVKSKLASVKIDDNVKVNGDVEVEKEDSGNEAANDENDQENEDKPQFYDKVKSFFDQISYEAIERSKGHTQRLDWKTERKINSETFGPVALRRNNNYRGPRPGGNYYNNYQSNNYQGNNYQNRNPAMQNKFRGGFRQKTPQTRRTYNEVRVNDDTKGNQSA